MTTQGHSSSQHLAAARELLVELEAVTLRPEADPQTKAAAAAAHAILVLAEQVAVVRVLLGGNALSQRADAQFARQQQHQPEITGR
jgi:hypothetical protein